MSVLRNLLVLSLTIFVLVKPTVAEGSDYFILVNFLHFEVRVYNEHSESDFFFLFPYQCTKVASEGVEKMEIYSNQGGRVYGCHVGECVDRDSYIMLKGDGRSSGLYFLPIPREEIVEACKGNWATHSSIENQRLFEKKFNTKVDIY